MARRAIVPVDGPELDAADRLHETVLTAPQNRRHPTGPIAGARAGAASVRSIQGGDGRDESLPALPADAPRRAGPNLLTRRQWQVAGLVAQGLTNRQVATRLAVTPGTAANHVRHIMLRLGFRSRAQIAAWAVLHGLPGEESD